MSRPPESPDDTLPAEGGTPRIVQRKRRISLIWLVPIVAAIAGAVLVYRTWTQSGPSVTIGFEAATGLQVGRTEIRFKDVSIGTVTGIRLRQDWGGVEVTADISRNAADIAREGTRFWVVRPRLALSGVSGLGTLISGAYIAVDTPDGAPARDRPTQYAFVGLERPPEITADRPGRRFTLHAAELGSLEIGSPIYLRRINAGQVVGYDLAEDGQRVNVHIFVNAPYDQYVTSGTRFWNASGVDVAIGAQGLRLRTQSVVSLLLGGIGMEPAAEPQAPAAADAHFTLHANQQAATAKPDGEALPIRMRFAQSVRGLAVGAPIEFKGMGLGEVTAITMDYDAKTQEFAVLVDANLFPLRLGEVYERLAASPLGVQSERDALATLVQRGLRAQLRTGNLLTGQLYVVLDFFPDAKPATLPPGNPLTVPTTPGELDQLQQQVVSIVTKLEKLPLDQIAKELQNTLANTTRLIGRLDTQVAPEAQATLRQLTRTLTDVSALVAEDGSLPLGVDRTMQELARAARSLRVLADYLQANPQSLLRGRGQDPATSTLMERN
ncbi:MCE family protein [Achromobacter sp. GG226]|uniref:PqiB family protein n=1 Tax=Verticiella alkaliphila TaxID=2779529 RepID=UPI001C0B6677|nr:MlaD family protein [Verticiella sp. GG226]MBU4612953.1 MCE family protein [Verticiella sp. GG226]